MSEPLKTIVTDNSEAYVQYLIAAEQAVMRGEFNGAKVLRALAYSHRAVAMNAARAQNAEASVSDTLVFSARGLEDLNQIPNELRQQFTQVSTRQVDIAAKARASLIAHPDIPEWVIAPFISTCINCGNIVEGKKPERCEVCHALSTEFETFGPFYSADAEHLGQRTSSEILEILSTTVTEISALIADVPNATLAAKPSTTEWSIKEIIGHLIETESLFMRRVDAILTGAPYTQSLPPWKLHEGKGYNEQDKQTLIDGLARVRQQSITRMRALTPAQWATSSIILGGKRSALDTGTWIANHDRGHIAQIKRMH